MLELGFTDGFEITSGLVQAFVASVFLRFRSSRHEWGLGWLALSYGAAAALNLHLGLFWAGPPCRAWPASMGWWWRCWA